MLKNKRIFLIALAVVFVVALFFLKSKTTFKNQDNIANQGGLTYGTETLEDLVSKDADNDEILDWQEVLYGLDPTKKETTPGIPDKTAIEKLKTTQESNEQGESLLGVDANTDKKQLTETEKFSRELFSTIATLNQNGTIDPVAMDQLGNSLADYIQNIPPRKVFSIFDIKIINNNTVQSFTNYDKALNNIYIKYPAVNYTILDVLQKFVIDENNVDVSVLIKLDPIIEQTNKIIEGMVAMSVPESISTLHLNVINGMQRLVENISDIKSYDNDAIVALGGISKYQENATRLESDLRNLANAINQKLNN